LPKKKEQAVFYDFSSPLLRKKIFIQKNKKYINYLSKHENNSEPNKNYTNSLYDLI